MRFEDFLLLLKFRYSFDRKEYWGNIVHDIRFNLLSSFHPLVLFCSISVCWCILSLSNIGTRHEPGLTHRMWSQLDSSSVKVPGR